MCAAQTALDIYQQQQNRQITVDYENRQNVANKVQMDTNRDLATRAYLDQATAAHAQLSETRESAAAQNFSKSLEAMKAKGAALTSAGESGVSGNSLHGLLEDFDRQENMFRTINAQNLLFQQQQMSRQVKAYQTEAVARTKSVMPVQLAPVAGVDYIGPVLRAGQQGGQMAADITPYVIGA